MTRSQTLESFINYNVSVINLPQVMTKCYDDAMTSSPHYTSLIKTTLNQNKQAQTKTVSVCLMTALYCVGLSPYNIVSTDTIPFKLVQASVTDVLSPMPSLTYLGITCPKRSYV